MQRASGLLTASAVVVLAVVSVLNWRAQLRTQQKLDALAAALAERNTEPAREPQPAPPVATINVPPPGTVPRELDKIVLPPYVIEAPDQLLIEVVQRGKVPRLGADGKVLENAKGEPVMVDGIDRLTVQPISGQFQVRPDGTVGLGFWGAVSVTGLTCEQASAAIRDHLARSPQKIPAEQLVVAVDVVARNSKRYYVITDLGGEGEQVYAFPITGSDTVVDAISNVDGLSATASKGSVRVARRPSAPGQQWQALPVDWTAITQNGVVHTNYQILSGDRVYVTRR